jgi:hypothetical protein
MHSAMASPPRPTRAHIIETLKRAERPLSPSEIADQGRFAGQTVRAELGRMKKEGLVTQPASGTYTLTAERQQPSTNEPTRQPLEHEQQKKKSKTFNGDMPLSSGVIDYTRIRNDAVTIPEFGGLSDEHCHLTILAMVPIKAEEYIRAFGQAPPVAEQLRFGYFIVPGDIAAPIYFDGERVPVERIDPTKRFTQDALCVYRYEGSVSMKRLRKLSDGRISATALNPAIEVEYIQSSEESDFAILGLVRSSEKQQLYNSLVGRMLRMEA